MLRCGRREASPRRERREAGPSASLQPRNEIAGLFGTLVIEPARDAWHCQRWSAWPLQRQAATPAQVLLRRGGTAQSTLTFLTWHSGDGTSFTPTTVEVTPPDDMTQPHQLPHTPLPQR